MMIHVNLVFGIWVLLKDLPVVRFRVNLGMFLSFKNGALGTILDCADKLIDETTLTMNRLNTAIAFFIIYLF